MDKTMVSFFTQFSCFFCVACLAVPAFGTGFLISYYDIAVA